MQAYQGRFGFGPTGHDIEIWLELENMACLDAWEEYVAWHQEEVLAFEAEWDQHFNDRGSRLMSVWPDPRWETSSHSTVRFQLIGLEPFLMEIGRKERVLL